MMQQVKAAQLSHAKHIQSVVHLRILIGNQGVWPDSVSTIGFPIASNGSPVLGLLGSGISGTVASSDDHMTWG
jgi:hypothetical protein